MAICEGCGNQHAYALHIVFANESGAFKKYESCDECGNATAGAAARPDVYWPGRQHRDHNIVDNMGTPILIESPRHKAQLLKERGMREANDRLHGGPGHRFNKR